MAAGIVSPAQSTATGKAGATPLTQAEKLKSLLALEVSVSVVLAERDLDIESILAIKIGTIVEFDVVFDSDLALHVANVPIGSGQAVKTGENFGIRIATIKSVEERVLALGDAQIPTL